MTLTNFELADNPSFPAAWAFLECPQCHYVSKSYELDNPQVPCPKCNTIGMARRIFPSLSALNLLKMVAYFYTKACDRVENLQFELVNNIRDKLNRTYDPQFAINIAREIQSLYKKLGVEQAEYEQMIEIIRDRLSLESKEEAAKVFVPLISYSNTFEEHKATVILTCTLIEKLFDDLLIRIIISKGIEWSKAERKVSRLRGFDKLFEAFEKTTSLSLKEAIGQCSIPNYFADWEEVRTARNHFIHNSPYAISATTAEKAFNLAKNASSLFAYLQNRFC